MFGYQTLHRHETPAFSPPHGFAPRKFSFAPHRLSARGILHHMDSNSHGFAPCEADPRLLGFSLLYFFDHGIQRELQHQTNSVVRENFSTRIFCSQRELQHQTYSPVREKFRTETYSVVRENFSTRLILLLERSLARRLILSLERSLARRLILSLERTLAPDFFSRQKEPG